MDKAYETACTLLHHMNCHNIHALVSAHNTDKVPAVEDKKTIVGIESIIQFLSDSNSDL